MSVKGENNLGQKLVEETHLQYFFEAYNQIAEEPLSYNYSGRSESPDFICHRPNDSKVGVELTQIRRSPEERFSDRVFRDKEYLDGFSAIELIIHQIQKKEEKRRKQEWNLSNNTILVLLVMDCPFEKLPIDDNKNSFFEHGFKEIWLADCTLLEEFNEVDLFCLFPEKNWGYYNTIRSSKSYG